MRTDRGFTMIEVAIVLGLMVLLLTPFLDLVVSVYRETHSLSVQADLMAEAERTAHALFRRAALGPYQLHPDNHGIRFADGSEVRFQDGTLRMGQQAALNPPPGVSTEVVEAGLDARKACIEERSVVGDYVSTAEVRLTTQTGPDGRPNATVGGGFRAIPLQDFAAIRRDGVLTVHMCFLAPTRAGGPVEPRHFSFDWPAAGVPR